MGVRKRFQKSVDGRMAEVWVAIGLMRYTVELYENGTLTGRQTLFRWRERNRNMFPTGRKFTALVHVVRDGRARCNLSG